MLYVHFPLKKPPFFGKVVYKCRMLEQKPRHVLLTRITESVCLSRVLDISVLAKKRMRIERRIFYKHDICDDWPWCSLIRDTNIKYKLKNSSFWNVTSYSLEKVYHCFGEHTASIFGVKKLLSFFAYYSVLKMKGVKSYEISIIV